MAGIQRELTLRFLAQPTDVNYGGKVFGGAVMGWIDQAAYALAVGWSGHDAVTVYVGGIQFEAPVPIGSFAHAFCTPVAAACISVWACMRAIRATTTDHASAPRMASWVLSRWEMMAKRCRFPPNSHSLRKS